MSTLDYANLFSSGPNSVMPGSWMRDVQRRRFAGVNGELLLDLGRRGRPIIQTGRFQADTAGNLHSLITSVEAKLDGQIHRLSDNHGRVYAKVLVEKFELAGPITRGRGFWVDYTIHYLQLP